jgi:hypothetical protein
VDKKKNRGNDSVNWKAAAWEIGIVVFIVVVILIILWH